MHVVEGEERVQTTREFLTRSGYEVLCYRDPEEFLEAFTPRRPQCFLFDVFLHSISGLELQRRVLDRSRDSSIILMTGNASVQMVVQAFRQGAVDFLERPWRSEDLLDAVGRAIERDRIRSVESQAQSDLRERLARLSQREREVLALIVQGHSSKSAAKALHVSKRTVDFHRAGLMRKLDVHSVIELVRLGMLAA